MSERDEYVKKMKAQLDRWNADIDHWEAELHQQRDQAMYQLPVGGRQRLGPAARRRRGGTACAAFEKAGEHFRKK